MASNSRMASAFTVRIHPRRRGWLRVPALCAGAREVFGVFQTQAAFLDAGVDFQRNSFAGGRIYEFGETAARGVRGCEPGDQIQGMDR